MKKTTSMNIFKKGLLTKYLLPLALLATPVSLALAGSVPNTFTPGTLIKASEVNANFSDLDGRSWDSSGSDLYYSGGNVGIGTTSPGAKLDVNGEIRFTNSSGNLRGKLYNSGLSGNPGAFSLYNGSGAEVIRLHGSEGVTVGSSYVGQVAPTGGMLIEGNVGIGTTNPQSTLQIKSVGIIDAFNNVEMALRYNHSYDGVNRWLTSGHKASVIAQNDGGIIFYTSDVSGTAGRSVSNWGIRFKVASDGNVGIGTSSPSYKLHVNGTAAGTSWTNISSREYKENIKKVSEDQHAEMLNRLLKMDLTTYKYKEEFGGDGTTKLGFIAEEMPKDVLSKDGKGVDVYELLAYTIGAVKEIKKQQDENKDQAEIIKDLKAQLRNSKALEERLARLEAQMNK